MLVLVLSALLVVVQGKNSDVQHNHVVYDLSHELFQGMPFEETSTPLEVSMVKQDHGRGARLVSRHATLIRFLNTLFVYLLRLEKLVTHHAMTSIMRRGKQKNRS